MTLESLLAASLLTDRQGCLVHLRNFGLALAGIGFFFSGNASLAQNINGLSISQLISLGQIEAARQALENDRPSEADRLFFDARVLKAKGEIPEAVSLFQRILQADPNYINARRELAHSLLINRDYSASEYQFRTLIQIDENERMRIGYRRFLDVINQNKPISFSGHFSILPSTNVNRGTTNTIFDTARGSFAIDPNTKAESGIGMQLGASGFLRYFINSKSRISVNLSLSGTKYEDERYNSAVGNLALSYERLTVFGSWSLTPYYRYIERKDGTDNAAHGLRFSLNHSLSSQAQLSLQIAHEFRDYSTQDYQDGKFSNLGMSLSYQFSPSITLSGGLGLKRSTSKADHLQYLSGKIAMELFKAWENGLQTHLGYEYGRRDFVGIFPLTTSARNDRFSRISFSVQNSRIDVHGFTPNLSCSFTRHRSNVAFYDYGATECQATISRKF